ncbi:MAG: hypothetical protein JXA25_14315 [Anaerolineales bacterium]|nr:hypothetical protein [Anaerolineales bacterium]
MLPWIVIGLGMVYLLVVLTGLKEKQEVEPDSRESDPEKELERSEKDRLQVFRDYIADTDWQDDQKPRP